MATDKDPLLNVRRVIVVSNVLPVKMSKNQRTNKWSVEFDTGPLFEDGPILTGVANCTPNAVFVGVPPVNVPSKERAEVEAALLKKNCHPVFVPAKDASLHYQGFCKSLLWPLFHQIIPLYNDVQIDSVMPKNENARSQTPVDDSGAWHPARSFNPQEIEVLWPAHMDFILKFKNVIMSLYGEGDLIWIHGYHLMMLVSPLRRQLPTSAPIGIFLHTPFPSSEVFRCLSKRMEIIESILQADHVGFHSYEYARHFLTCTQRMLGYAYGAQRGGVFGIRTNKGRTVTLTTAHAGLDMRSINDVLAAGLKKITLFPETPMGKFVICGVDEVEGLRGLALKLLAIDRLLMNVPALRGRVVVKQVGINLDSRPHDFARCLEEVNRLVAQLNEKWGEDTVMFQVVTSFPLEERLSLYSESDVLLLTCVRWGLSVDAMEFMTAHKTRAKQALQFSGDTSEMPPRGPGVLVTSEFVSTSRVLAGAIKINPWSVEETAKALEQALGMSMEERMARCFRNLSFIEKNTVTVWTRSILRDLASCSVAAQKGREQTLLSYGLGVGMRAVGVGEGRLERLDVTSFAETFAASKGTRVLCFDYSGTLVATTPVDVFVKSGGQARAWHYSKEAQGSEHTRNTGGSLETRDPVSPDVVKALKQLAENPQNRIVIMSMDLRDELYHAMKAVPNVILVAENGYATYLNNEWRQLIEEDDAGGDWYGGAGDDTGGMDNWQRDVKAIINVYVERTSGSFIFTAPSSVSFNYTLADPELGEHQSKSLGLQLETRISGLPLVLELGKGTVTVRTRAVNRGAVLTQLLKLLPESSDFVACFGDDVEDELMFRAALDSKIPNVYTCRVGVRGASEETRANYYLDDESDVADLVEKLCESADTFRPLAQKGLVAGAPVSNPVKPNRGSFAMLPGGFVTKKSLVSLQSLVDEKQEDDIVPIGGSPSLRARKPSSLEKVGAAASLGLPHTPSMGRMDDLPPAPSAIPLMVSQLDSPDDRPLKSAIKKSPAGQPATILKKINKSTDNGQSPVFGSPAPSPSPSPVPLGSSSASGQRQQQNLQSQPQKDAEIARLAAAAVGGAVTATALFMLYSVATSYRRKL